MSDDEYLDSLPPGYRFCPTDEELVIDYLMKRISNETLPPNRIREVNLYRYSPQQLYDRYKEPRSADMYFFTPRDRKYPKGNRPSRVAGDGYWKASGANKPIRSKNSIIGYNRSLVYHEGEHKNAKRTDWLMREYTLHKSALLSRIPHDMKLDDWVICKVYRKPKESKKEQGEDFDSDVPSSSAVMVDNETSAPEPEYASGQTISNQNMPQLPSSPLPDAMYDIGNSQLLGGNGENSIVSMPQLSLGRRNCTSDQSLPSHNGQIISHDPGAMFYTHPQQMPGFYGQSSSPYRMMPHPVASFQGTSSQMLSCYGQDASPLLKPHLEFLHPNAVRETQNSFPMSAVPYVADGMSLTSSQSMPCNYSGQHIFPMPPPIQAHMIRNTGVHVSDQVLQCQYYNDHHSQPNQDLVNPIRPAAEEMNTAHQVPNIPKNVCYQTITSHQPNQGYVDGYADVSSTTNGCGPSRSSDIVPHAASQRNDDKQFGT